MSHYDGDWKNEHKTNLISKLDMKNYTDIWNKGSENFHMCT